MPNTLNQNLSRLGQQLLSIWKQLGLNQRISILTAAVVVIAGLCGLAYWSGHPSFALLYGRLDDGEAAKVIAALDESKVPYQISQGGGSILVPSDRVHKVRMQLAAKGVPAGEGVGFEIFDKPNFGISDFVQRANYTRAIQGELARTISQMEGVESARVMITLPETRLLGDAARKPTAAVLLKIHGRQQITASAINAVRFLVANSVEGLAANNVVVTDQFANLLVGNRDDESISGQSSSQLEARRNMELYLSTKAREMLEPVVGPGQAVVRVAADINWDTVSRTEEKYDPDGTLRSETIDDEDLQSANGEPSSRAVGTATNSNTDTNAVATISNSTKTRKKRTTSQFEINKITSTLAQGAGSIKRLSAAVFVATRYEGTGPTRKLIERTPEELQKLRRIVQGALGIVDNGDGSLGDQITLEEMPFNDDATLQMSRLFEQDTRVQLYWQIGKNVLYALLGLGVLIAFWKLVNRPAEPDALVGLPNVNASDASPASAGSLNLAGSFPGRRKDGGPGVVTVDMLNQLIRENPEGVTQAVRSWLTRGSNTNN